MGRHGKDLRGSSKSRGHRPWTMRKSVTAYQPLLTLLRAENALSQVRSISR